MSDEINADELTELIRNMARLRVESRGLLRDVRSARREVEELRTELRAETASLRADMATMMSRQNSRIEDNKKKSHGLLRVSRASTGS